MLCQFFAALRTGSLVAVEGQPSLSEGDISRIAAARRIVDTRWHEKLTIDNIARSCGINRDKLTRGFRELYHCSVGEALSERRLRQARSEEHTSELQSLMRISYAVFCLKKKNRYRKKIKTKDQNQIRRN